MPASYRAGLLDAEVMESRFSCSIPHGRAARTTRAVSSTEAGERLPQTAGSWFEEIEAALQALSELCEKPAGTIRITSTENTAEIVLLRLRVADRLIAVAVEP